MKQTIAVIFGGRSTEHDVSIITAISAIIKPLELSGKFSVVPVYITKDGAWYADSKLKDITIYQDGSLTAVLAKLRQVQLSFDDGLQFISPGIKQKKTAVDVVFPAMHGTYGEDGSLMGLLRMANVPFVGCDMAASSAAMDKVTSKLLAEAHGLPITKMKFFSKHVYDTQAQEIVTSINTNLTYPVFVKPAHMGSSIGLTKVDKPADLTDALEVAFHYDFSVLVEEGVHNLIEVTLPIMGNEEPVPALLEQPLLPEDGVFDFDTKYMKGGKKGKGAKTDAGNSAQGYSVLPAKLDDSLYQKAVTVGIEAYQAIGCEGYARIDMLIDGKTGDVFFNEINPLPGSLYAHNWRKAGLSSVELVEKLIAYGVERHARDSALSVTFDTSFLKQF
jgi:D-alanine-D-alanine ligase